MHTEVAVVYCEFFYFQVNKLSLPAITSAIRQAEDEELQQPPRQFVVPARQEKVVPVTREQIREKPDFLASRPPPLQISRQASLGRQESKPLGRPLRPVIRQEFDDNEENIPRQPIRPKV